MSDFEAALGIAGLTEYVKETNRLLHRIIDLLDPKSVTVEYGPGELVYADDDE